MSVARIHQLVRENLITPTEGAKLLELHGIVQDRRRHGRLYRGLRFAARVAYRVVFE